jgi:hypothetical protein
VERLWLIFELLLEYQCLYAKKLYYLERYRRNIHTTSSTILLVCRYEIRSAAEVADHKARYDLSLVFPSRSWCPVECSFSLTKFGKLP